MKRFFCGGGVALVAASLMTGALAHGATINYGDFVGSTVHYLQVTEAANSVGDTAPLFGPPTVTGDSIDFDPVGFSASATGASGVDLTDGNLKFDILAKPTFGISSLKLTEAGDTTLAGFGTDATFSSVTTNIFIDIKEVDGVGINQINYSTTMSFTPSGGTYGMASDGGGGPLFNTNWSGVAMIDIDQILADAGVPFTRGATLVTVNLDNTLVALSENGTSSLIAKKDADGVTITVIPEPSSAILALLGSLAFGWVRRRS
jgi:hypothetical protein